MSLHIQPQGGFWDYSHTTRFMWFLHSYSEIPSVWKLLYQLNYSAKGGEHLHIHIKYAFMKRFYLQHLPNNVIYYCFWSIILPLLSHTLHRRFPRNRNDLLLASNCLKCSVLLFSVYFGLPYCLLLITFYSYFHLQMDKSFLSGLYS